MTILRKSTASFKLLSTYVLEPPSPDGEGQVEEAKPDLYKVAFVETFRHPNFHPLALTIYPHSTYINISNITRFESRIPPPFPALDSVLSSVAGSSQGRFGIEPKPTELRTLNGSSWALHIDAASDEHIVACSLDPEGRIMVGVGSRGTIWMWAARKQNSR